MSEDGYKVGKEAEKVGPTVISFKETPLMALMPPQEEMFHDPLMWAEDKFVPIRWYHIKWMMVQLWWISWRRGDIPMSGILCAISGKHCLTDWRGRVTVMNNWTAETMVTGAVCLHCRHFEVLRTDHNRP